MSEAIYTQEQMLKIRNENYQAGIEYERERIVKMFEDIADHLDTMRPESYKSVADKMDLRIRVIRFMAKRLKENDADSELGQVGQVGDSIRLLPS